MGRVRLCGVGELPLWGGRLFREVDAHGRDVLIFRRPGGGVVAWDAACPHAGAMLRPENELGGVLTCFLHRWRFSVEDGQALDVPGCALVGYPAVVEAEAEGLGGVYVELPDTPGEWALRRRRGG